MALSLYLLMPAGSSTLLASVKSVKLFGEYLWIYMGEILLLALFVVENVQGRNVGIPVQHYKSIHAAVMLFFTFTFSRWL